MRYLTLTGAALIGMLLSGCRAETGPTGPDAGSLSLTAAPGIGLAPTRLSFVYYFRQRLPPSSQVLKITNLGGGTLAWTATSSPSWLKIQPKTGTAPSAVTVSVDPAVLPIGYNGSRPGLLQANITVSAVGASNTPQSVPVVLYIHYY